MNIQCLYDVCVQYVIAPYNSTTSSQIILPFQIKQFCLYIFGLILLPFLIQRLSIYYNQLSITIYFTPIQPSNSIQQEDLPIFCNLGEQYIVEESVGNIQQISYLFHLNQQNPIIFIMKQTSSHSGSFKQPTRDKNRIEILDLSEGASKAEDIQNIKEEEHEEISDDIQRDLQLNLEKYSQEVKEQLKYLLIDLLKYPSSKAAFRHRCSHRLGYNDLKHIKNKLLDESTYTTSAYKSDHCSDCGLLLQERQIPVCSSIWQFPKAGIATFLLFKNMKLTMGHIFFLGIFATIIGLYVNITQAVLVLDGSNFPFIFSYGLEVLGYTSTPLIYLALLGESILIIVCVLVWWFMNLIVQCLSQKYERIMDQACISASDFSIMLQNVPIHYTKEILQAQFERYFDSLMFQHNLKNTWGELIKPFNIKKLCVTVPFALSQSEILDQQLQGLDRDILLKKKLFADWVFQMKYNSRFTYTQLERQRQYVSFQKMVERRRIKIQEMEQRAQEQYNRANKDMTTTMIVTFQYNQSADIIEDLNPQAIPAKLRYWVSVCKSTQYFHIRDYKFNQEADIVASKAPTPQDIIWGNVQVPLKYQFLRKLLTWAIILLLWGLCIGIVFAFSYAQINGAGSWTAIVIGLTVVLINMFIKFVLRKISPYEKDFTETERQRGILLKGLFALAVNWILPPAITNIIYETNNYFTSTGLVYEITWIAIFGAFLPPLIRIFDPENGFRIIRAIWKSRPAQKIVLKQSQLNDILENEEYELGWCYIYFIDILFFTCFYVTMIPGVTVITLFGCLLMFLAEKYCLLNRSLRPEKIARTLCDTVGTLFSMVPFVLWLGHLIWINFVLSDFSSGIFTVNMVLMALSILYFITPWKSIFSRMCHTPEQEILSYDQCRSKFTSEYDRLNPATIETGIADYLEHLQTKKKQDDRLTNLNRSADNLIDNFDPNFILEEITKIPSIFGRKNDVSRKVDKNFSVKPRNIKGEEVEVHIQPQRDINEYIVEAKQVSPVRNNNQQIFKGNEGKEISKITKIKSEDELYNVNKGRQVNKNDRLKKRNDTEEELNISVQDKYMEVGRSETDQKNLNFNSSGFGYRKSPNDKRRTISVIENVKDYQYDNVYKSKQT